MLNRKKLTKWIIVAIFIVVVVVIIHISHLLLLGRRESLPMSQCPTVLGYTDGYRYHIISGRSNSETILSIPLGISVKRFLGLVRGRSTEVYVIGSNRVGVIDTRIISIINGITKVILVAHNGDESWSLFNASLWKDKILIPSVEGGQLRAYLYDLNGQKLMQKEFHLPNGIRIRDEVSRIEISDAGLAVTDVFVIGRDAAEVYLFDKNGKPISRLGNGTSPVITADGSRVAFVKWYSDSGRYKAVIYDVIKKKSREIITWRPLRFRDAYPLLGGLHADTLSELQWSPNGKWLVCGLRREFSITGLLLITLDVESNQPKRCYLPEIVESGQWVVLKP